MCCALIVTTCDPVVSERGVAVKLRHNNRTSAPWPFSHQQLADQLAIVPEQKASRQRIPEVLI